MLASNLLSTSKPPVAWSQDVIETAANPDGSLEMGKLREGLARAFSCCQEKALQVHTTADVHLLNDALEKVSTMTTGLGCHLLHIKSCASTVFP